MRGDRGVSSVVSTVLMVGIVVLIAIPAGIYAMQVADPGSDPSPNVKRADQSMTGGASAQQQVVSVTHGGGDTIDMENVEIVVRLDEGGERARIVNLPTTATTLSNNELEGSHTGIVDQSYDVSDTPLSTDSGDSEWTVDETVSFKIDASELSAGEQVTVTFVHTETNSILGEETFNASA